MIISTFFNLIFLFVLTGYSFFFKRLINTNKVEIFNLDLLYGFFLLLFISLFLNFFLPLKFLFYIIVILGVLFFIEAAIKKKIKINFFVHFITIFLFLFIIYQHSDNADTPMYHLQIIKWLNSEKIVFGLSNLEIRFGSNSLWFGIISLFQFKIDDFNTIYTFNIIPFSVLVYQIIKKENSLSYIFIVLTISYILFFSFLHPFRNGVILNHLHNTEIDTAGMIFFILSFYLFLKFFENNEVQNLRLLITCSIICFLIQISYAPVILFALIGVIKYYKKNLINLFREKLNLIIIVFLLLWLIKNFINSGCLIFPVSLTCFNVSWSPGIEEIDTYSKIVKGFARDTRDRLRYLDFDHTIHTYNWLIPWFKDYVLNTALIIISFYILLLSTIFILIFNRFKLFDEKFLTKKKIYIFLFFVFFPNIYVWFLAPEIRFGWGLIIAFCCYPLSILIYHFKYFKKFKIDSFKYIPILVFLFLILDNNANFTFNNLITPYKKAIDYSKIVKVKNVNGYDIFQSKNWKCYDFKKICVNSLKKNYDIKTNYGYLMIKNDQN